MYQMIFDPIRLDVANITEIGVHVGQYVQAWYHYFPRANIYAVDVVSYESMNQITAGAKDGRIH